MKTSSALATTTVLLLAANMVEGWGRFGGGFDNFGRRPTVDPWGESRRARYPQQQGWPRQVDPQHRRNLPTDPPPAPPSPPPLPTSDPNDDFTAAFLKYAGEDVILSSLELGELMHAATAEIAPPSRRSVIQILQQWDGIPRDGHLNLSEFMRMYGELQRQMPSSFQQHWNNLRRSLADTGTAPSNNDHFTAPEPPSRLAQEHDESMRWPRADSKATAAPTKKAEHKPPANGGFQPRKGRLNYIEKGERFFELVYDDEDRESGDGPLTVQTIVSTRVVGDVDSWAESDVW